MKKLNIKWRIMLWHTSAIVLLFILTLPTMYLIISNHLYSQAEALIRSDADKITRSLRIGNGMDEPNSEIDFVQTNTFIAVYSTENEMISGRLPQNFEQNDQPVYGKAYYNRTDAHEWIVLDRELIVHGRVTGWFRVVKSLDELRAALSYFRYIIYIIILVYTLFSILTMISGGFLSRALSPVKQITKTAKEISQGDLTKRIAFEGKHDEVGKLAATFNEMVDCLEDTFNREKRFSSDVSHELRTPVTAIMISAEEALSGEKTTDEYKESLEVILRESRKMNSLISQLLIMSRCNNGTYSFEMEPIDISRLTTTVVAELSESKSHPDISISSEVEDGIVMKVEETLYMRMLINLIDNALKYNIPGGWVEVSLNKINNDVILSVKDSGIGIAEEDIQRIWERFYKADQSRIDSSPGLGLSIVKWIADLHGGTVNVKSELGKGSLFEIKFYQE